MTEQKTARVKKSTPQKHINLLAPNLSHVGLGEIAYVRAIGTHGADVYGIFAANGEPLATVDDRNAAMAATLQNDLVPVSVH